MSFTRKHQFIRVAMPKHECQKKKKCDRAAFVNAAAEETAVESHFNFSCSKTELGKMILRRLKNNNFRTFLTKY